MYFSFRTPRILCNITSIIIMFSSSLSEQHESVPLVDFRPGIDCEYQESKNGTSTTINVSYFFGVNGKGGGPSLEAFFLPCVT